MLQQIPNPTNNVEAVSTGYQRQNTNLFILQTGLDTTEPYDNGQGVITIPAGGVVDVNGVLYKLINDVVLNKPNINIAYWCAVTVDDSDLTIAKVDLIERPGKWNIYKRACYTDDNRRVLNWYSLGNLNNLNNLNTKDFFNKKRNFSYSLNQGFYYISLRSGSGGGDGGDGSVVYPYYGAGGVPIVPKLLDFIYFVKEKKNVNIKIGGSGLNGEAGRFGSESPLGAGAGGGGGGEETVFDGISTGDLEAGRGGRVVVNIDYPIATNSKTPPGRNGTGLNSIRLSFIDSIYSFFANLFGDRNNHIPYAGRAYGMFSGGGGNTLQWPRGNFGEIDFAYANNGGISGHLRPDGSDGGACTIYNLS